MFKQFQDDLIETKNKHFSKQNTFQIIDPTKVDFVWRNLFHRVLQHIRPTNIDKDELTSFSRQFVRDNKRLLKEIEEFETNYTSYRALHWYTRATFLYCIMNPTLRTQKNFNNIFKFRFYITDLVNELKTTQEDRHHSTHCPDKVYRGQLMQIEEIEYLKYAVGKAISSNQFLSASKDIDVALFYVENLIEDSLTQSVLFTIKIDSSNINSHTTLLANISQYSHYPTEQEVLFSMHSTFRVQSVQLGEHYIWRIHLKFVDNLWNTDFDKRNIFSTQTDQISFRYLLNENNQFITFQLLLNMILQLDQTKYAKDELLEFSRSKYRDDPIELKKIDHFEISYRSEDAAKWYTKDSFLYRLLNESLHTEIIDYIVKMRYFIHDLHNQLAQFQPSFIQSLDEQQNVTLYRSQTMKRNQLNELRKNRDGFISMKTFFSATQNEKVARTFSGVGITRDPDVASVIYEMMIDTNIQSTPYAKIESVMLDEHEILFSMGSVFRVGEVDALCDHVYRVKLRLEERYDEQWNK
jgi:hypothetical protein